MKKAGAETLIESLASALDAGSVTVAGLDRYAVDGMLPKGVITPRSVEETARAMNIAYEMEAAVVPWGNGLHMPLGNPPRRYDIALSTAHLNQVLEYEPADLTISVQAGVTLRELNERLGRNGQFLPLDPPGNEKATLGGVFSAEASGPLRYAYGTCRDWVIGIRVVHADGAISKSGGMVVKNVAGYDMSKLYAGSCGSLAVIVEVNLKVATLPKARQTAFVKAGSLDRAVGTAAALNDQGLSISALAILNDFAAAQCNGDSTCALALQFSGTESAVRRSLEEAERICAGAGCKGVERLTEETAARFWSALRGLCQPGNGANMLSLKASVLPTQAGSLAHAWQEIPAAAPPALVIYPSVGAVQGLWQPVAEEAIPRLIDKAREGVATLGGRAVVEACPYTVKQGLDVWGEARSDFPLMRRLKEEMDPRGILSPGRFMGRL